MDECEITVPNAKRDPAEAEPFGDVDDLIFRSDPDWYASDR